jgi:uncharacterized protein
MNGLFVDTSGWMACADRGDPLHSQACAARDAALEDGLILITTDFVVDETLTLLRVRLGASATERWWKQVDGSARVRWERVSVERFDRARSLFFKYRDKDFSFTDCTSFAVMQELRLARALATDRHFTQMGFRTVPGRDDARRRRSIEKGPHLR